MKNLTTNTKQFTATKSNCMSTKTYSPVIVNYCLSHKSHSSSEATNSSSEANDSSSEANDRSSEANDRSEISINVLNINTLSLKTQLL